MQVDHIRISHPDAAVTGRFADLVLPIRAMDVNVALQRVGIFGVQTLKPQNTRCNQVTLKARPVPHANRQAPLENRARRLVPPDLLGDPEVPGRRAIAAQFKAHALFRRGNRILCEQLALPYYPKHLVVDGNLECEGGVHRVACPSPGGLEIAGGRAQAP